MFSSSLYLHSPIGIQQFLISTRARIRRLVREGRTYEKFLGRAVERERWSRQQLLDYQAAKLRELLKYAGSNVPYYTNLLNSLGGADIDAINRDPVAILLSLPYMSKREILDAGDTLIAREWRRGRIKGSTSGTTGTPVTIIQDIPAICRENAFVHRQLLWSGYRPNEPRVWLRGDMVVHPDVTSPPYWRMSRAENMLMMSSYHLSEGTVDQYLAALKQFNPTMIQAYPSSIGFLARYLDSQGRECGISALRSVVTSSETLSDEDRSLIERTFKCKVFDWYGSFERVAAIGTCEHGKYHLLSDYSYTELEPLGHGSYELVGTGFNNRLMPLVRFRTGDVIELDEDVEHCACGKAFPIVRRIFGRQDDYIKLSDGRRIGRMDHVFKGLSGIAESQIIQDDLRRIRVLIVPFGQFESDDRRRLTENVHQRLGDAMQVDVEVVSSIPRTSRGKFRAVICKV